MSFTHAVPKYLAPPFFSTPHSFAYGEVARSSPASATYPSTNRAYYMPIIVPSVCRLYRWFWLNGATVGTNLIQAGLYYDTTDGPGDAVWVSPPVLSAGTVNLCQFTKPFVSKKWVTQGASTTDGTTFTTASVQMYAGKMYLLSIENTHGTTAHAVSSVDNGPTFTSRATVQFNGTLNRVSLFSAVPTTNYSGTLVINYGANTETGCGWILEEFDTVDTTTNDGVVQTATGTGSSVTPLATLAAFGAADNATFGVGSWNSINTLTPGAGFTLGTTTSSGVSHTTPSATMVSEYRFDNDTTVDGTITSSAWGMIGAEIKCNTTVRDAGLYIPQGRLWLALWCNGTTATIFRAAPSTTLSRAMNTYLESSLGAGLPQNATPAQNTTPYLPIFGFTTVANP